MDYDTFGTALDSVLILAAAVLCGLHLWFSAAMASVQKLGGQMSTLAEEHPPMQYYLKQKNRLRITAVAEVISFTALLTLAAYLLIFAKGWAGGTGGGKVTGIGEAGGSAVAAGLRYL